MAIGPLTTGKKERKLERFDIVLTVLLAGWVPSILMLLISYTTLKNTLESKILRDRQTFVQLIAHLVDDDLASTASIISYYQTLPDMERLFAAPNPQDTTQQWIAAKFFSYPRIDGMFIASADGKLLGTLPAAPNLIGQSFHPEVWKDGADGGTNAYVSPVHHRAVDDRMVTDVVGAIRRRDGKTIGYIGASILIERIGRRLSSISFADKAHCRTDNSRGSEVDLRYSEGAKGTSRRGRKHLLVRSAGVRPMARNYPPTRGDCVCSGSRSAAQNYRAGWLAYCRYPGRGHPGREILPASGRSYASD
ncbi:MAG: hypothetical protein DME45_09280 [Verrucomicrobia bacterium]|nr:MAG: hypothetical protein DME45_09280 [Verrucomicrobiota bacterium]